MTVQSRNKFQWHPYHLVSPSPWPMYTSFSLFSFALCLVLSFQLFPRAISFLYYNCSVAVYGIFLWFRDVIAEATYKGNHTLAVQRGITIGVALFIVSEALFFLAIFWAFFHSALSPTIELGASWPPLGIDAINPFELPLLNTVLLLSSGVTITFSHHSLIMIARFGALLGAVYTLVIAVAFTSFQGVEYTVSSFTISDGIFASCFYFGTGFHGFHVIIGTLFLLVGFWRLLSYQLTNNHHVGFESGILYWHFVDIVWIFLYSSMYYWGAGKSE